jgi:hypothetical protein
LVSAPFPHMATPPALSPIRAPWVVGEDAPDSGCGKETLATLNDPLDLVAHVTVGEFTVTCVTTARPLSDKSFTDDSLDLEVNSYEDSTNVTGADAFEDLVRNHEDSIMTTPDQHTINEVPDVPDPPEQRSNDMEAGNSEAIPEVVIDHFPSAGVGAPIPGMSHEPSANESNGDMPADSIWSPFASQCDWFSVAVTRLGANSAARAGQFGDSADWAIVGKKSTSVVSDSARVVTRSRLWSTQSCQQSRVTH